MTNFGKIYKNVDIHEKILKNLATHNIFTYAIFTYAKQPKKFENSCEIISFINAGNLSKALRFIC